MNPEKSMRNLVSEIPGELKKLVLPAIQWVPPDRLGDLRRENRWQF